MMHFKIGDSAATMRLWCGAPIKDANWTQSPHEVDCPNCLQGEEPDVKRSHARALLDAYARAAIRASNLRMLSSTQARTDLTEALRGEATLRKQLEDLLAKVEVPHHASSSTR